jgi:hypothetical protein
MRNAYTVFAGKYESKRPLENFWHELEDSIEIGIKETV